MLMTDSDTACDQRLLLARLREGQHATVLQLPVSPRATNEAEQQTAAAIVA